MARELALTLLMPLQSKEDWVHCLQKSEDILKGPLSQKIHKKLGFKSKKKIIGQTLLWGKKGLKVTGVKKIFKTLNDIDKLSPNPSDWVFKDWSHLCEELGLQYLAYHPIASMAFFEEQLALVQKTAHVLSTQIQAPLSIFGCKKRGLHLLRPPLPNEKIKTLGAFVYDKIMSIRKTNNKQVYVRSHFNHPAHFAFFYHPNPKQTAYLNLGHSVGHEWVHSMEDLYEFNPTQTVQNAHRILHRHLKKLKPDLDVFNLYFKKLESRIEKEQKGWNFFLKMIWDVEESRQKELLKKLKKEQTFNVFKSQMQPFIDNIVHSKESLALSSKPFWEKIETLMENPTRSIFDEYICTCSFGHRKKAQTQAYLEKGHSLFLTHACLNTPTKSWTVGKGLLYPHYDYWMDPRELLARIGEKYFHNPNHPALGLVETHNWYFPQGQEWASIKPYFENWVKQMTLDWKSRCTPPSWKDNPEKKPEECSFRKWQKKG